MQLIATRRYPISDANGTDYAATDTLHRLETGQFVLRLVTDGLPGEPDSEKEIDPGEAFAWLSEVPEQVEYHAARHKAGRTLILV